MMYALNIDTETGRILSATFPKYASADAVKVDALPEGNLADYLYVDGGYVLDPLPEPETSQPPTPQPTIEELQAQIDALTIALLEGGNSNA